MFKRSIAVLAVVLFSAFSVMMLLAQSVNKNPQVNAQVNTKKPVLQATAHVTQVYVIANPRTSGGQCPKRVEFKGTITTNGAAEVKYTWLRSDGAEDTNPHSVTFTAAGSQTVTDSWELGQTYSGWEILKVTSPNTLESRKAGFVVRCQQAPSIKEAAPVGQKVQ